MCGTHTTNIIKPTKVDEEHKIVLVNQETTPFMVVYYC